MQTEVVVVGAGIAGLTCARRLCQMGYDVTVLEKSRGVGGRVATRRLEGTIADHGTCYLSPKTPLFQDFVAYLAEQGIVQVWTELVHEWHPDGLLVEGDRTPRYTAATGMTAIAKALTSNLDIRFSQRVTSLAVDDQGTWHLEAESTHADQPALSVAAKAVVLTMPAPQAVTLLRPLAKTYLPESFLAQLESVMFFPSLSLMAGYSRDRYKDWLTNYPNVKTLSLVRDPDLAWLGLDSSKRGAEEEQPVFVLQSTPGFAERYLNSLDLQPAGYQLLRRAAKLLASWLESPEWFQVHRWRYALVVKPLAETHIASGNLVCSGDWCGGSKVDDAFNSGLAAADWVNQKLKHHPLPNQPVWRN